jgi:hypothetical protein
LIGSTTERGLIASFDKHRVKLVNNGKIVGSSSKIQKRLYKSNFSNHQPSAVSAALVSKKSPPFIQIWHERLGYKISQRERK